MSLSIQGLRVYVSVLDLGSLSAAGRELGISQPAVSNHLSALEEHFGVPLLARGRPPRQTLAGRCLEVYARRVLAEVSALEAEMVLHAAPRGRLLVGASSTPGDLLLPEVAVGFSARYPEVALDLHIADTDETVAALMRRDIELAVVGREVDDPHLSARTIEEDELAVVVSADEQLAGDELDLEELAARPLVLREPGSATRRTVEKALAEAGIRPRVAMEIGSNAAVAGAVAAGAGVGFISSRTLKLYPALRRIVVRGLSLRRPFVLVTERDRPLSPAAEAFAAACSGKEED